MTSSSKELYPYQKLVSAIYRGAFIVIEGLDRAGKTTQAKKLCDVLYAQGHNIKTLRFPDRTTPIGKMIDSYLQSRIDMDDHAIHLLFSANRWEKVAWIKEQISQGYTIICDRYYYSGMIYSAAKNNPALSLDWARSPDVGLPRPDRVVFLDLSAKDAELRGGYGEEKYEKRELQERVRRLFLGLMVKGEEESNDMVVVDAGYSVQDVADVILAEALKVVVDCGSGLRKDLRTVKAWPEAP